MKNPTSKTAAVQQPSKTDVFPCVTYYIDLPKYVSFRNMNKQGYGTGGGGGYLETLV